MTEDARKTIGIIGGTGPLGRGLALRWAIAGHTILVGSRTPGKAETVAEEIRARANQEVQVHGVGNRAAAQDGEIVVVSVPYRAQQDTLPELREVIGSKIVVNVVNPMEFDGLGAKATRVPAGSAAEECQELLPEARVVSAFHDVPSARLWRVGEPMEADVLVCSDDREAAHRVGHLAAVVPGMWPVNCGPLRNSQYVENMTPVLIAVNRHYSIHASIRIDGVPREDDALHLQQG